MSARTSILAGANPKYSKFDPYKLYRDQLDIPESNLSRFDLIFVLTDDVDKEKDSKLADALLNKDYIVDESEILDIDFFKKYITWMKANCFPVLSKDAKILLREFYVNTRAYQDCLSTLTVLEVYYLLFSLHETSYKCI